MGYTHYLYRTDVLDEETFAAFMADARTIVRACPYGLVGDGWGEVHWDQAPDDRPAFGVDHLSINGMEKLPQYASPEEIVAFLRHYDVRTLYLDSQEEFYANGEDGSHESLYIERVFDTGDYCSRDDNGFLFSFCKTAQKPYDIAVTALLIAFVNHFPEACRLSSDGDREEWEAGLRLAEDALGRSLMIPPEIKTARASWYEYFTTSAAKGYRRGMEIAQRHLAELEAAD
jgi:hypothetical protein